jgi:acyl carrier protein
VTLSWTYSGEPERFDALLQQRSLEKTRALVPAGARFKAAPDHSQPLLAYASNPLRQRIDQQLILTLRDFLKERLPAHMLPTRFVLLDAFPLEANGKIDRQALPVPEQAISLSAKGFVAPRTPVEEAVARLWMEELHLERAGIYDDFFALGGHSLLATQIVYRLRDTFQVDLSLRTFFEVPTIEHIALAITQAQLEQEDEEEMEQMLDALQHLSDDDLQAALHAANLPPRDAFGQ